MSDLLKPKLSRRRVLQAAAIGAIGIDPALRAAVWAQGSDKPEKEEVKIGFIPLTDCASVVMASVLGNSAAIRGAITRMLESDPDVRVVAKVANGQIAVEA